MEISSNWQSDAASRSQRDWESVQQAGREAGIGGANGTFAQSNMAIRAQAINSMNGPAQINEPPWKAAARSLQGLRAAQTQKELGGQGLSSSPKLPTFSNLGTVYGDVATNPLKGVQPVVRNKPVSFSVDPLGQEPSLTGQSFEDQSKPLHMKEGGIIERVGNMLGLRKPVEAKPDPNRVADQFGGLSGEAARSLRARPRQIEEELKRQGLRKGKTRVSDPDGSPTEDTVDAKLADGEAVLNAGAAEMLGRDEIERLNAAGAEKLGLRCGGGPKMVGGVMHAARGGIVDPANLTGAGSVIEQRRADLRAFYENEKRAADAERAFKQAGQIESPRNIPVQDGLRTPRTGPGTGFVMRPNPNSLPVPRGGGPVAPFERAIIPEPAFQRFGPLSRVAQQAPVDAEIVHSRSLVPTGQGEAWSSERLGARDTVKGSSPKAPSAPRGLAGDAGAMVGRAMRDPWGIAKKTAGKAIIPAAAAYGAMTDGFSYVPDEGENPMLSTVKNLGLQAGNVGTRALDLMSTDLINLPGNIVGKPDVIEPFNSIYRKNMVNAGVASQKAENPAVQPQAVAREKAVAPQVMELSAPPSAYEQAERAKVDSRKGDQAAFSKFFSEQGITDEMRKNPSQGLRQIKVPGSTDQIYRRGNEYIGMGAPSRIAAEQAKAEDPVLKRAAAMEEMRQYALQGNENAAKMYNQMIEQDSAREVEGLRSDAAVKAAGAKSGGKGEEMEYKLLKDFADEVPFNVQNVDDKGKVSFEPDLGTKAAFNDFWRADLQNQIQKAKKSGQPLTGLDDPARAQAYMQDAKKRFDLMQSVNAASAGKASPTQFNRGLRSVKPIEDLTIKDWLAQQPGETGGHTLFDASWDNMPFTAKGGMRLEDEYGYGQTLPAHNTDLTLGTAQRALLEKMKGK